MNSDVVPKEWLEYYRMKMRRILTGRGFPYENIHFLPEPFAVYLLTGRGQAELANK